MHHHHSLHALWHTSALSVHSFSVCFSTAPFPFSPSSHTHTSHYKTPIPPLPLPHSVSVFPPPQKPCSSSTSASSSRSIAACCVSMLLILGLALVAFDPLNRAPPAPHHRPFIHPHQPTNQPLPTPRFIYLDEVGVLRVEVQRHHQVPHRPLRPPQALADLWCDVRVCVLVGEVGCKRKEVTHTHRDRRVPAACDRPTIHQHLTLPMR